MRRAVIVLGVVVGFAACGDDATYGSFQQCFDDQDASTRRAIISCCQGTIDGRTGVCGTSATTCASYVSSNLEATSASSTEIFDACTGYEDEL